MAQKVAAVSAAATGSVITHDRMIPERTSLFPALVTVPIPKSDPTETCVVDTARPRWLAKMTRISRDQVRGESLTVVQGGDLLAHLLSNLPRA